MTKSKTHQMAQADVLMVGTDPNAKGGISSVVCLYREGGLFRRAIYMASYRDGHPWQKILFYSYFLIRYFFCLWTRPSIRLVHVHTASYFSFYRKSWVVLLARCFKKRVLLHIHGAEFVLFYQRGGWLKRTWIRWIIAQCHCVLALSAQWRGDLQRLFPGAQVRVLYNPTQIRVSPKFVREDSCRQSPVRFLFMGRIGKRKGVYDILDCLSHMRNRNFEIQLYGDGELDEVAAIIRKNNLQAQVKLRGWIHGDLKDAVFRQADVLLLPSYNEGLPISILEALAYGLPVVATAVGGISEAVIDGKNGFLIEPGQCELLADRMERLNQSPSLRRKMGRYGFTLAQSRFNLPIIVRQLEALYDECIQAD